MIKTPIEQSENERERSNVSPRRLVDEHNRNQMDMLVELSISFESGLEFQKTSKISKNFETQSETFEVSDGESSGQKTKTIKRSLIKFGRKSAKMLKLSETLKRPTKGIDVPPKQNQKAAGEEVRFLLSSRVDVKITLKIRKGW